VFVCVVCCCSRSRHFAGLSVCLLQLLIRKNCSGASCAAFRHKLSLCRAGGKRGGQQGQSGFRPFTFTDRTGVFGTEGKGYKGRVQAFSIGELLRPTHHHPLTCTGRVAHA
jgi:hypothetical protein